MKLDKPKINTAVFENFSKLTNKDENVRISGAYSLIQHFEKSSNEKVNKHVNFNKYILLALTYCHRKCHMLSNDL